MYVNLKFAQKTERIMKKTNRSRKTPKETGTWYKSLIEGKTKAEYYRHFIKKLNDIITEHFGSDEAKRVLNAIKSGKIQDRRVIQNS